MPTNWGGSADVSASGAYTRLMKTLQSLNLLAARLPDVNGLGCRVDQDAVLATAAHPAHHPADLRVRQPQPGCGAADGLGPGLRGRRGA